MKNSLNRKRKKNPRNIRMTKEKCFRREKEENRKFLAKQNAIENQRIMFHAFQHCKDGKESIFRTSDDGSWFSLPHDPLAAHKDVKELISLSTTLSHN